MNTLYKLENIKQYHESKEVLSIESLTIEQNQIVGFFGPNGSGKSTLFSLLSFIEKPDFGDITFEDIKQNVVLLPQNPYLLKRTVYENIAYGLKLRNETKNLKEKIKEALHMVGLDYSFSKRKWSQLSGGEAQRIALASRLILKPKVLILDEPTSGVDTNSAQLIKEAILQTKQKYNTTIFISSHDHNWLNHICDKKIALFKGNIVESGSVNLIFAPWEKDNNGNLVKLFLDKQKLTIPNSNNKKRDSVIMVNSKDIHICRKDCKDMINENTLIGKINSIRQQQGDTELLVEFYIGGICFNSKISRDEMKIQRLLPSDKIHVNIDVNKVCWI